MGYDGHGAGHGHGAMPPWPIVADIYVYILGQKCIKIHRNLAFSVMKFQIFLGTPFSYTPP